MDRATDVTLIVAGFLIGIIVCLLLFIYIVGKGMR